MSNDSVVGSLVAGRFQVLQLLGGGVVGSVYLAENEGLDRQFAIKVLRNEPEDVAAAVQRFGRVAMAIGQVDHPNIASISDFGRLPDGRFYLAMEYVPGIGLGETLAGTGRRLTALPRALKILDQIAAGLAAVHDAGVVHGALKPDNVLLGESLGGEEQVKLIETGLGRLLLDCGLVAATELHDIILTPAYLSPEQARGEPGDSRSDIYSFGVLAFELLTGRPPFSDEDVGELLIAHLEQAPPMLRQSRSVEVPQVPHRLETFVMQCLEKDPAARPQRLSEVHRIIEKCLGELEEPRAVTGAFPVISATASGGGADSEAEPESAGLPEQLDADSQEPDPEQAKIWSQLGKKALDLAQMLKRRELSTPEQDQLSKQMEELDDQLISLEMDVVMASSQIDDLDAEYRDRETAKRHAILYLSRDRILRENAVDPDLGTLAELAEQIQVLESGLGKIYAEKEERQQDSIADKEQAHAKLLEVDKAHAACTKRLLRAFRHFNPKEAPRDVRKVYHSIARLLAGLYRGA
ncbi:MAG: protein kinase [bacterium]